MFLTLIFHSIYNIIIYLQMVHVSVEGVINMGGGVRDAESTPSLKTAMICGSYFVLRKLELVCFFIRYAI